MNRFALERAYQATTYRVSPTEKAAWVLRAGAPSPRELESWLIAERYSCWSLLSACNPASCRLSEAENTERQVDLRACLIRENWRFFSGENQADANDWPPEANFWIPGMRRDTAERLASVYGQNAFLWGCLGQNTELVWVKDIEGDELVTFYKC